MRPIDDILNDIDTLIKEGFASTGKPHELETKSIAVDKLPSYMSGLGNYLADADSEAELAKDDYDYLRLKKEKAVIDTGTSVAVAERTVGTDDEIVLAKDKLRQAKHNYKILKLKYDSADRQFEGWRSRLSVIKQDLRA